MAFTVGYLVFGVHLVSLSFDSREEYQKWNSEMENIKAAAAYNNTFPEGRERTAKIRRWFVKVGKFRKTWGDGRVTEDVRKAYESAAEHIGTTVSPPFGPPPTVVRQVNIHEYCSSDNANENS